MQKRISILALGVLLLATACDKDETATAGQAEKVEFDITTRGASGNTAPNLSVQDVRLYLGEHKTEHGDDKNHLHLREKQTLENGTSFLLEKMPEQRYKFAFVCVPRLVTGDMFTEVDPLHPSCDFNHQIIDFLPVLNGQPSLELANYGHVYRQVINRWLRNGETLQENVTMTRLNGQLRIDMGILQDQFEHPVTKIEIVIKDTPTKLYIRDNDNDELLPVENSTEAKTYTDESPDWNNTLMHYTVTLNLLPSVLEGSILVYREGFAQPLAFTIRGGYDEEQKVRIKRNTRTTLEFNGLHKDYFTVKYAGFDGSQIGVDDDDWDGWNE